MYEDIQQSDPAEYARRIRMDAESEQSRLGSVARNGGNTPLAQQRALMMDANPGMRSSLRNAGSWKQLGVMGDAADMAAQNTAARFAKPAGLSAAVGATPAGAAQPADPMANPFMQGEDTKGFTRDDRGWKNAGGKYIDTSDKGWVSTGGVRRRAELLGDPADSRFGTRSEANAGANGGHIYQQQPVDIAGLAGTAGNAKTTATKPFAQFAAGTRRVPGHDTGEDTVPAMLRPGEAVLTPGAAEALGRDKIEALNKRHAPRGMHAAMGADGVQHFNAGGFVDDFGDVVKATGQKAYSVGEAKKVKALQVASANAVPAEAAAARIAPPQVVAAPAPAANLHWSDRPVRMPAMPENISKYAGVAINNPVTRGAAKLAAPVGIALDGYQIGKVAMDDGSSKADVAEQTARAVGGWGSAGVGAALGGKLGLAAGALTGPAAPVAAPILGAIGGLAGGVAGYYGADKLINTVNGDVAPAERLHAREVAAKQPQGPSAAQQRFVAEDARQGLENAWRAQEEAQPIDYARDSKAEAKRMGLNNAVVLQRGDYADQGGIVSGVNAKGQATMVGIGNADVHAREAARVARVTQEGKDGARLQDAILERDYKDPGAIARNFAYAKEANDLEEKRIARKDAGAAGQRLVAKDAADRAEKNISALTGWKPHVEGKDDGGVGAEKNAMLQARISTMVAEDPALRLFLDRATPGQINALKARLLMRDNQTTSADEADSKWYQGKKKSSKFITVQGESPSMFGEDDVTLNNGQTVSPSTLAKGSGGRDYASHADVLRQLEGKK